LWQLWLELGGALPQKGAGKTERHMYPVLRFAKETVRARRLPRLGPQAVHHSTHLCWPIDIDPWMELNNGRTLTLYDLGRMPLLDRLGFLTLMRDQSWGMVVAGASIRYRRRVKVFNRFRMQWRCWVGMRGFSISNSRCGLGMRPVPPFWCVRQ